MKPYIAGDLFSGCGGLSEGIRQAGFELRFAIESDKDAAITYKMNHPKTKMLQKDIREVNIEEVKPFLGEKKLHLLACCPPCQGFSSIRRLNKKRNIRDGRNKLILEFIKFVKKLKPLTVMMENVPGLINYYRFKEVIKELKILGYNPQYEIVDIKDYGVPQRRKRLVLVGSIFEKLSIAKGSGIKISVRDTIGNIEPIESSDDPVHKVKAIHSERIDELIKLIPKNGGSRSDLPGKYTLECHKKENVGFNDIYGRLSWDDYSSTITGGCLNPSKGRFLHPEEDRGISAREAALLQTFPRYYKFPVDKISKQSLALLIGNALPPKFSFVQCENIKTHLDKYLG